MAPPERAQVVVVGGGVVGASVLYHLTTVGITDCVLVERSELTSGSTWHAAGGMHTLNGDPNVAALQQYTVQLYEEIERISGVDCGIHLTGGLMLADTAERMDWLRMAHARGRYLGMDTELLDVAEAKRILPFMDESYFVGALYDPMEGHVDPSGVTRAYAGAARLAGAEVVQHTRVEAVSPRPDGDWDLHWTTPAGESGTLTCEHVVNAGGLWAREVGRMFGIELPVLAMEHMYLLTNTVPELAGIERTDRATGLHAMDFAGEVYMRQEGDGLLLGTYEPHGVPWSPHTTPWDFGHQLLTPDLERIGDNLERAFAHFPIFHEVGIKQVINGPFTFAPDGNPLIGPVRGQRGHWIAAGVMAGLSQGGGVGLALANWIAEGDPGFDVWGMDVARFGDFATAAYTNARVRENYGRRFRIAYPNEELEAARPLRTSPVHGRLDEAGAVWGAAYGLEHALWFSDDPDVRVEVPTLRRSNAWDAVAAESRAVREGVGLIETTGFATFEVSGIGARAWLDRLCANRLPTVGRIALTPLLDPGGKLLGDVTVACLPADARDLADGADERFLVFGSGIAERHYQRWFDAHLPGDGTVRYDTLGADRCGLSIAGPASRDLLASLTVSDVSPEGFAFLDVRRIDVGTVPVVAGRITFTGDLGWELWCAPSDQARLYDELVRAGEAFDLRLFGGRALDSLRLEKSFGSWATEFRPIYTPDEAGLGWAVKPDKGEFVGRDAVVAAREGDGPARRLVTLVVDAEDADVIGDEPIWHDDEVVGWVTSGGYAHWSQASVALGYVRSDVASATDGFAVEVVGQRRPAQRHDRCLFDPSGSRMRS